MSTPHRTRLVNPRLGTYFGIFASAFIGLFLVVLIFEQLDAPDSQLKAAVLFGPLVLFITISVASLTNNTGEFFAAGRRVPAVYNGLTLSVGAIGGTGLIALTGLFFLHGFDTWFAAIGLSAGFLVMGTAIAPYLRKFGAYTVPSYLARRFESRSIRLISASIFAVPMLLLLAAELGMAVHAAALLTGYPSEHLVILIALTLCATTAFGGMRAVGWVTTAQAMATIIAIIVLAATLGVMMTNLPVPQLSYGPVLRQIGRMENVLQLAEPTRTAFEFVLAGQEPQASMTRLASPFTSMGWVSFIASVLTVMMGIAAAPWLLPRCTTTLGVYEARKSLGWAIFFAGIVILTLSSIAIFLRAIVMSELAGRSVDQLPAWFMELQAMGLAKVAGSPNDLSMSNLLFSRDGILFAIPRALDFPDAMMYLVLAGAIAAALAAAATTAFSLAAILAE
ncbi:MAG: sodium:solute symporter, partial [Alphaproteobacteria bacterium]|nr:sodium:solute symporter [Alphaproteobacteria bacterium]